jgi:hypothetical protein
MDPNGLFRELEEAEPSEDRTVWVRETAHGDRTDFESIERTSFRNGYPETTKELRSKPALPCGHHVTKETPFGGYCVLCREEYCARCARICPRCGRSISSNCCAREFESAFFCKPCRRALRIKNAARVCLSLLLRPFLAEPRADG